MYACICVYIYIYISIVDLYTYTCMLRRPAAGEAARPAGSIRGGASSDYFGSF